MNKAVNLTKSEYNTSYCYPEERHLNINISSFLKLYQSVAFFFRLSKTELPRFRNKRQSIY